MRAQWGQRLYWWLCAGAVAQAAKTRARSWQGVAVGTGCWCEQGQRLLWLRSLVATGSGEADAVKLRAAEAGFAMAQARA